ncbi:MAG: ATP-binding protein [Flavobacteriales bacterium]|jgi:two-component system, OmpR family, phosphate regulon sensor histidine kinase PhoR|nr:ATP-binding protein [Flavobacteriales bacterium]|tara:strand:+ start:2668 stop:3690 length:1023 start_codon:yes stop_codon:yes gene_type:complete
MQWTTPKKIAFYLTLALSVPFFILFSLMCFWSESTIQFWQILTVIISSTISIYIISFLFLKKFIHERVKVIYKSLTRQRGVSDDVETDLNKVDEDVDRMVNERQREIEELKNMESFRREFLGNVSHELKTPIFNIQGYIHTLIDGAIRDENVNMQYLERSSKSVDRMINIVEDLEMISKIESNRLELEFTRWNIVDHIQELFDILEMKAKKRSITLSINNQSINNFVEADRDKISQVLINLIENSIKYGNEGGHTKVRLFEMGENILVEIADDGDGIPSEHLPRLFERFYRVDKSRSRSAGGTGLGLSIVKHIVDAHRQTINVRSTENVGTTFSFTLKKA